MYKTNTLKYLFLCLALTYSNIALAKHVTPETATLVAQRFYLENSRKAIDHTQFVVNTFSDFPMLYIIAIDGDSHGFVIVPNDDIALPVLGYSFIDNYSKELHDNIRYWLNSYQKEIDLAISKELQQTTTTRQAWEHYTSNPKDNYTSQTKDSASTVGPLLLTTWAQSPLYNNYCPEGSEEEPGQAVTGCTATAMAQIMAYWKHPLQGQGAHCYRSDLYDTICADFNTTYQWGNMPDVLTTSTLGFKINAVAKLIYHCGVSVEMNYSPSGSGAWVISYGIEDLACAEHALVQYFKYKNTLKGILRNNTTTEDWTDTLLHELDHGRPMIYVGYGEEGGHSFVCDGYDNGGRFHFNWGWGGHYDGFFPLDALDPYSGMSFDYDQELLFGIEPDTSSSPVVAIPHVEKESLNIRLIPNPTTGRSSIDYDGIIKQGSLLDQQAREILTLSASQCQSKTIDLSALPSGIYTLRILTDKGALTCKVVRK